jgi:hypothetical protein
MYLGSEIFTGFANVNTVSLVDTWLKFFAVNMLWVVFPGYFVYESVKYLVAGGRSPMLANDASAAATPVSHDEPVQSAA